ncbi:helix-turn-helix domain-containing protein [Mycobacterium sp.]|uniref:helix-turn-helix domain-containing protein n=1 Tax=Mycobacterium sp. TaxID=1785 RepID=UPI003F992BF6
MPSSSSAAIGEALDLKTIQKRYGIAVRTSRDWIRTGKLPAYKVNGSLVRVRVEDVEALFTPIGGAS